MKLLMEGDGQFILEIVGRQKKDEYGDPVWTDKENGETNSRHKSANLSPTEMNKPWIAVTHT